MAERLGPPFTLGQLSSEPSLHSEEARATGSGHVWVCWLTSPTGAPAPAAFQSSQLPAFRLLQRRRQVPWTDEASPLRAAGTADGTGPADTAPWVQATAASRAPCWGAWGVSPSHRKHATPVKHSDARRAVNA